ncbi:MAG: YjjG family noncanonical pyrimidine nucleotidase [Bacteroidales bacterium]
MSNIFGGIETLYIDLDDTLWDFSANAKVALHYIYDKYNIVEYCEDYKRFSSIYIAKNHELWEQYHHNQIDRAYLLSERFRFTFSQVGLEDDNLQSMAQSANDDYLSYIGDLTTLVDGAVDLLQSLQQHYKVNMLSNGFHGIQFRKLRGSNLEQYFNRVILSDDINVTKPQREIFDYALGVCNAQAATSIMIGDNYDADILGAHNAGWRTIHFNRSGEDIPNSVADLTVSNLSEISQLLIKLTVE